MDSRHEPDSVEARFARFLEARAVDPTLRFEAWLEGQSGDHQALRRQLSGVQDSEGSPLIRWTLECKLVDLRPGAMPPLASFKRWSEKIDTDSTQFGVTSVPPTVSFSAPTPGDKPPRGGGTPAPRKGRPGPAAENSGDSEPNNSLSEAMAIEVRGSVNGTIGVKNKEDWFVVVPHSNGHLSVRMTNTKPKDTNGQAPFGVLQSAVGKQLERFGGMYHANQSNQTNKEFVMAGSTYYIHLTTADPERNVPYRLDVRFDPQ